MPSYVGTSYARRSPVYDDASSRLFGAIIGGGGQVSDARRAVIDIAIRRLKNTALWDKLDVLHLYAASDSVSALINWVNPGTYNGGVVNAPTFTADQGYTGNGTTSYVDTTFDAAAATAPKYAQNSASFSVWSLSSGQTAGAGIGGGGSGGTDQMVTMNTRSGSDLATLRINSPIHVAADSFANTDGSGLFTAVRRGATSVEMYRNGASIGTGTTSSAGGLTALPTEPFGVGRANVLASYTNRQFAAFAVGSELSTAETQHLYNALFNYLRALGTV
jgi:hypothetical protein